MRGGYRPNSGRKPGPKTRRITLEADLASWVTKNLARLMKLMRADSRRSERMEER